MNKRKRKKLKKKKLARKYVLDHFKEKLFSIDFSKCELSYEDIISINEKQHTKESFKETIFYKKMIE